MCDTSNCVKAGFSHDLSFLVIVPPVMRPPHPCFLPSPAALPTSLSARLLQVCSHPGLRAAAAPVPQPLWLPPQVASDSTGSAAIQRGQPQHRGPAEKGSSAEGVCGSHGSDTTLRPLVLSGLVSVKCFSPSGLVERLGVAAIKGPGAEQDGLRAGVPHHRHHRSPNQTW